MSLLNINHFHSTPSNNKVVVIIKNILNFHNHNHIFNNHIAKCQHILIKITNEINTFKKDNKHRIMIILNKDMNSILNKCQEIMINICNKGQESTIIISNKDHKIQINIRNIKSKI